MKTIIEKHLPLTEINNRTLQSLINEYETYYHSISMNWINDWAYKQLMTEFPGTEYQGPEAKAFAEELRDNLFTLNMVKHYLSYLGAIYSSTTLDINTDDYEKHPSDAFIEYGKELGLPIPFIHQVIIWVWG